MATSNSTAFNSDDLEFSDREDTPSRRAGKKSIKLIFEHAFVARINTKKIVW
jgi:hypothetical protein